MYEQIIREEEERRKKASDEAGSEFFKATGLFIADQLGGKYADAIIGIYDIANILNLAGDVIDSLANLPSDSPAFDLKNCEPYQIAKYQYALYENFLEEYEALNKTCTCPSPHAGGCECVKAAEDKFKQLKNFHDNLKDNLIPNYKKDIETWYNNRMIDYFAEKFLNYQEKYELEALRHAVKNEENINYIALEIINNKSLMEDMIKKMPQGNMSDEEFTEKKARYAALTNKVSSYDPEDQLALMEIKDSIAKSIRDDFYKDFQEQMQKVLDNYSIDNLNPNIFLIPIDGHYFYYPADLGWLANKKIIDDFYGKIDEKLQLPETPGECTCNEPEIPIPPKDHPESEISPLILDLDGDGVETISVQDGVYFDHDNNLFGEKSAWVAPDDALLIWDSNKNGKIDGGNELFGNNYMLKNGEYAKNGFEALAEFDSNGDGIVNKNDER